MGRNFPIPLRENAVGESTGGMDYYSDDYPDVTLEEFLDVYRRLTKYAQREVHDLAVSLADSVATSQGLSLADSGTTSQGLTLADGVTTSPGLSLADGVTTRQGLTLAKSE